MATARELEVPPGQGEPEIAKIIFDDAGNMIIAERQFPSGAYNMAALTRSGESRVLRFRPAGASDGSTARWIAEGEYAVGRAGNFRNGNGG